MKCEDCGIYNSRMENYCKKCGKPLKADSQVPTRYAISKRKIYIGLLL